MPIDPSLQSDFDALVAEVTAKFDAEKQAALTALKEQYEVQLAVKGKEAQSEILLALKSAFGLSS
jgi:hypothetical protein